MIKDEYDLLCYCIITSATLREAIERTRSFLQMLGERGAIVKLEIENDMAEFQLFTHHRKRDSIAMFGDLTGLSAHYRLFSWLVDLPLNLVEVKMFYPQLINNNVALFFIPFPITYNTKINAFRFPSHFLDKPIIRSPEQLKRLLIRFPFDVEDTRGPSVTLRERVRAVMVSNLLTEKQIPDMTTIAATLGVSVATLKRRLQIEGTSYSETKMKLLSLLQNA